MEEKPFLNIRARADPLVAFSQNLEELGVKDIESGKVHSPGYPRSETNVEQDNITSKLDVIDFNQSWNDSNEQLIVSVGENAASYKWMHEKSSSQYYSRHQVISFILVVLTIGLSGESLLEKLDGTRNINIDILRYVFTYLITIVTVIQSFLKYQKYGADHKNVSLKFSDLYNDIRQMMTMYRKTRKNANEYIRNCTQRYDALIMEAPDIPWNIIQRYKKIVDEHISQPTIADRIQNISIISEKPIGNLFKDPNPSSKPKNEKGEIVTINNSSLSKICDINKESMRIKDDITDTDISNIKSEKLRYELERLNNN